MSIKIISQKFKEGEEIPDRYACKGVNVSPPLEWSPVVDVVKYAIICEDPDAAQGIWTHWVIFNIPKELNAVDEWIMEREETENGAKQGLNDFGTVGYRGPCPPDGTHRYYYRIYALDSEIDLPSMITRTQLKSAMDGHIIDEGSLMGRYTR
jgi:Raf kinase inhibitor-like YbhB/YbcL family protein